MAATLAGAALTAGLVLGGVPGRDGAPVTDGAAAGLRTPSSAASGAPTDPPATPVPTPTSTAGPTATPVVTAAPATAASGVAAVAPTRVTVPRLGVDMAVEPEGVDERGQMGLPSDPAVAGWYRFGAAPDDAHGAVVVAAHVDSRTFGVGPFSRLGSTRVGDEVRLLVAGREQAYRVTQVARVDKADLDEQGLFSLGGPPRVHLVTCTGDYVPGQGYQQNLVVVAERVGA